ncbi:MAG TPA: septal ring lytic transglycosylase RlpA family protein [Nitrospiraceae bacterium]|nr:septal ring lytic transglycosylase RlpA family protein [Nitrospiraceae bacterium]
MRAGPHTPLARFAVFVPFLLTVWTLSGCAGAPSPRTYPPGYPIGYVERGTASWYGPGFHGNHTANGERFDMHQLTAAHRTLPLGSVAVVRSLTTGRQVTVRINDRGPFARGRMLDLSYAGARALGMTGSGTDEVELRVIGYEGRPGGMGFLRVQVGSFADPANARALIDRLKGRYPDSRIVTVELPEGKRYRVQVGQFTSETQAEAAAERLGSLLDVTPFVVRDDT